MGSQPFYDPTKSYEENYDEGPFSAFADGEPFDFAKNRQVTAQGEPKFNFLGQKLYLPFGIPAGPLLNSNFCAGAFRNGFDIAVYKTVRSGAYPCHPFPNVLAVHPDGDLTLEKAVGKLMADTNYEYPLSITNSFGVPSKQAHIWQEDVKKAIVSASRGQVLVLSFMGTVKEGQTEQEFIDDWALAAKEAKDTGAKVFEANLSCPNIGNEGLVCYNLAMTQKVCQAIRGELDNAPLILKVGYYQNDEDVVSLAQIAQKYAQAISSINTIPVEVVDQDGNQALPGKNRARSGVCGASIKWAGLDMAKRLKKIRENLNGDFLIIGVGGVTTPHDFFEYRATGADAVMSATGAMWNPYLAKEIKEKEQVKEELLEQITPVQL